jgi:hypothetical protein
MRIADRRGRSRAPVCASSADVGTPSANNIEWDGFVIR